MKRLLICMTAVSSIALAFTPFYFIHWSDPQIDSLVSGPTTYMAMAVNQINAMRPRAHFAIVAGDMSDHQNYPPPEWNVCDSLFDLLLMDKYVCPGNNDLGYPDEGAWTPARLALYRSFWGPDYYSVTIDSCHFIALNSVLLNTFSPHACYPASLAQDSFLRYDLLNTPPGSYKHMFMFYHFPTFTVTWDEGNDVRNNICRPRRDTILAAIKKYKIPGMFAGHRHSDNLSFYDVALLQTGLTTNNGGGYRVVKVFGDGYEMFTVPLSSPIDTVPLVKIVTIAASAETVMTGQSVDFTALVDTAHYPAWTGLGFRWYFGDGDSSNLRNPTHVYADTGLYTVHFRSYKLSTLGAYYKLRIIVKPSTYVSDQWKNAPDLSVRINSLSLRSRRIVFEIPRTAVLDLKLYNAMGELAALKIGQRYERGTNVFALPTGLSSGIYFLKVSDADTHQTFKIIFMK